MITLESLCAAVLALLALIGFNIATGVAIELLPDGVMGPGRASADRGRASRRRRGLLGRPSSRAPKAAMLVFACRERLGDHHETPAPDERRAPGRRAAGLRIAEAKREGAISDVTRPGDARALVELGHCPRCDWEEIP